MTIRDTLLANITTALSGSSFGVSSELPFESGGTPLHVKNMKTVYVDDLLETRDQLYRTLDQNSVYQTLTQVQAFLSVDAKNQPSDTETVITSMLNARNVITGTQVNDAFVESEIEADVLTYTFQYNITKIT